MKRCSLSCGVVITATVLLLQAPARSATVTIDASDRIGPNPHFERYNTIQRWISGSTEERLLKELGTTHIRGIGSENRIDAIGALPITNIWGYPSSLGDYENDVYNHLKHFKNRFPQMKYCEIMNEPDGHWYHGGYKTPEEYMRVFKAGVKAVERLNRELPAHLPRIRIGGPVTYKWNPSYLYDVLDIVVRDNVTFDFIVWHDYHVRNNPSAIRSRTGEMRDKLRQLGLDHVEIIITEWGIEPGGDDKNPSSAELLESAAFVASGNYYFMDGGADIVCQWVVRHKNNRVKSQFADSEGSGKVYPMYNVLKMMSMMKDIRVRESIDGMNGKGIGIGGWGTADNSGVAALVWNYHGGTDDATVRFTNLPSSFRNGSFVATTYLIDDSHSNYKHNTARDRLEKVKHITAGAAGQYATTISMKTNSIALVVLEPTGSSSPPTIAKPSISNHPDGKTIEEGQSATFAVSATGNALSYQWQRNGSDIAGATGSRLTVVNASRSLDGSRYRCRVSNEGGSVISSEATLRVNAASTTPNPAPAPPASSTPGTILVNGDFSSGTTGWTLYAFDGAGASMSVADGVLKVLVDNPGPNAWSIQLIQNGVTLENGATYTLTATMRADRSHAVKMGIGQNYSPWSIYGGGHTTATLGGSWRKLTKTFTMNRKDERARAVIDFGASSRGAVYLSEIVLAKEDGSTAPSTPPSTQPAPQPSPQPAQPTPAPVVGGLAAPSNVTLSLVSATRMIIKWRDNADTEQGFEIERSDDGGAFVQINTRGREAERYADNTVRAGGKYAYRVRAYNREGVSAYSAVATWGNATIPSDDTPDGDTDPQPQPAPTPTGANLVPNGDFSQGTAGWALYRHNGSRGSMQESGGDLVITLDNTGTQHWHVQLINDGIDLRKGRKYILTVSMKSSVNRGARVGVSKNYSPWSAYGGLTTVDLGSRWYTLTKVFTAGEDDDRARIEIDLGEGPAATVTVGEVRLEKEQSALGKMAVMTEAGNAMLQIHLRKPQRHISVEILDMRGRRVGAYRANHLRTGLHAIPLRIATLSCGLYVVRYTSADLQQQRSLPLIRR